MQKSIFAFSITLLISHFVSSNLCFPSNVPISFSLSFLLQTSLKPHFALFHFLPPYYFKYPCPWVGVKTNLEGDWMNILLIALKPGIRFSSDFLPSVEPAKQQLEVSNCFPIVLHLTKKPVESKVKASLSPRIAFTAGLNFMLKCYLDLTELPLLQEPCQSQRQISTANIFCGRWLPCCCKI